MFDPGDIYFMILHAFEEYLRHTVRYHAMGLS
jgi:hypothetical protein